MRHLTILVGLSLPVLACNEPAHWNDDRAAPVEATPEPVAPRDTPPRPAPEARVEPPPAAADVDAPDPEGGALARDTPRGVDGAPMDDDVPAPDAAGRTIAQRDTAQRDTADGATSEGAPPGITGPQATPGQPATPGRQDAVGQGQSARPGAVAQRAPSEGRTGREGREGLVHQGPAHQGQPQQGQAQQGQAQQGQAQQGQAQQGQAQAQQGEAQQGQVGQGATARQNTPTTQPRASTNLAVSNDPRLTLKGPATQGGLVIARVQGPVSKVTFPGHRVNVDDDGTFLLAFARTAPATEKMTITFADGSTLEQMFQVAQREYQMERIDGLPEDEVRVDAKDRKEHAAEDARIQAARMKTTDGDCALQGFAWPARGQVTSRYGQPRTLNGQEAGVHWGVDLAVPTGTPVAAPACGTIAFVDEDVPLSGGTMVIDHGRGVTSTFLHLSGFQKKVGDVVKKGEVVARSGASGRATGAHLDWRMNYLGVRIDPELLVPAQPGTM